MSYDEDMPDFVQGELQEGQIGEDFDEEEDLEDMLEATLEAEIEATTNQAPEPGPSTAVTQSMQRLPRDANGLIDASRLSAQQRKEYEGMVASVMTTEQMERFEDFKRATFKKPMRELFQTITGAKYKENDMAVIALSALAKVLVGELVEEGIAVAGEKGEGMPLQPAHIHVAFQRLKDRGQIETTGLKKI